MIISKIEIQKKNKARYSLYSDDVFLFGVTEDTLIHFGIGKGKEYSEKELHEIQRYEQVSLCLQQSYRYLQRRAHLKNELRTKLRQKKYPNDIIDQALEILGQKKYLDDAAFIGQFIKDALSLKKMGPLLIKQKLFAKGADRQLVEEILSASYAQNQQTRNALSLAQKKKRSLSGDSAKLKQKLFAFLKQKGYETDTILTVLAEVNRED